jgi:hypothetical protein
LRQTAFVFPSRFATDSTGARCSSSPGGGRKRRDGAQRLRRQHRSRPGSEVLGGEILPADLAHVGVHVGGVDHLTIAVLVDVLEELVAGQLAAGFDDPREPRVSQIDRVLDAALAAEFEAHRGAADRRVPIAHLLQSDRAVVARILRCRRG